MLINFFKRIAMIFLLAASAASVAQAQSTAFTFQGKLMDAGNPADGMYEIQFRLFDTSTVGTGSQQGMTLTFSTVQVENGGFTVLLNFGAGIFTGPARFLEVGVRPTGSADPYTILEPRQAITTTPYALRASTAGAADAATNATQLGGIGPGGFIQNTTSQQAATNFNVSGNGVLGGTLTAGAVNATTQYNIGNSRILSNTGPANLFAGVGAGNTGSSNAFFGANAGGFNSTGSGNSFFGAGAGLNNASGLRNSYFGNSAGTGNIAQPGNDNSFFGNNAGFANAASDNSFFGASAGSSNTDGTQNSFFGRSAGTLNQGGDANSFFGYEAGKANNSGSFNSFFGKGAGGANMTGGFNSFFGGDAGKSTNGSSNSFFGAEAGRDNASGVNNSFFGRLAGASNMSGNNNTFVGVGAGGSNTTESGNTFIGANAEGAAGITNATALGLNAQVTQSNSLVLGSINGVNTATASTKVGIGTTAPIHALDVRDGTGLSGHIQIGAPSTTVAERIIVFGDSACGGGTPCVSIGEQDTDDRMVMRAGLFRFKNGAVEPDFDNGQRLGGPSNRWSAVWAAIGVIQTSDARLKRNVTDLGYGLAELMRLRPVTFFWKDQTDARRHVGLIAQEAETVIPESVVRSANPAAPLGMNYADLVPVLIKSIQQQQRQIESLKALVCQSRSNADACK